MPARAPSRRPQPEVENGQAIGCGVSKAEPGELNASRKYDTTAVRLGTGRHEIPDAVIMGGSGVGRFAVVDSRVERAAMRHTLHLLTLTVALSLTAACGTTSDSSSQPATGGAPTIDDLRSATFHGLADIDHPVTLASGYWEDEPNRLSVTFPHDFHVLGDLDGSAPDEAVVTLAVSTGGSGTFNYLAIVGRRDGAITNIATAPLGDRVQLRDLRIDNGAIVADVLQAGPDDAMCCPGELVTRSWTLEGSTLTELPKGDTARLSIDALGTGTWALRSWTLDEDAPTAPEVTVQLSEGRLVGSSGCNTYNAAVAPGDMPGGLTIGPVAGTRMMCPDAEMTIESRFLAQLEKVTSFGFMLGQLSLTYRTDDGADVMLFDRR